MEAADPQLTEISELSNKLMVATECLLPFERKATMVLRAGARAIQLDVQLMALLLSDLDSGQSTESNFSKEQTVAKLSSGGTFENINTVLKTLLASETFSTIAERHRNTDRHLHREIVGSIAAISRTLEIARRLFNRTFKAYWVPNFLARKLLLIQHEVQKGNVDQLSSLLVAFHDWPFAVGSFNDGFIASTPPDREGILSYGDYNLRMGEIGTEWARVQLRKSQTSNPRLTTQQALVQLLWGGGVESMDRVDEGIFTQHEVDFSEMEQASQQLADSLRDSIIRNHSRFFSIVFVGAEDSGKSTFLNAFIGTEILPSGEGPTTSYPVRIRHVSGQQNPVMRLGIDGLQGNVKALRDGEWHKWIAALVDDEWDGDGLPIGFDFASLEARWKRYDQTMVDKLGRLTACGFEFPTFVQGAEKIQSTLRDINDFVRICRNLPIGFDHFAPHEWPIITMEFPNLVCGYSGQDLELIDIPGYDGFDREYEWDEMIRQTIRAANVLIPVVSLRRYDFKAWRRLPRFISNCTNMQPSALVVTMRDAEALLDDEIGKRTELIRSVFWPVSRLSKDSSRRGPAFVCSAKIGALMREMRSFLDSSTGLPPWESFWTPERKEASEWLFPARMRHVYVEATLEALRRQVDDIIEWTGLPMVIAGISGIADASRERLLLDESQGIILQTKRVSFDLRRMLAAVGKALGHVKTPASEQDRAESNEMMELLDIWSLREKMFDHQSHALLEAATKNAVSESETYVDQAILRASVDMNVDNPKPSVLRFRKRGDIDNYMLLYETAVTHLLNTAEESMALEVLGKVDSLHQSLFAQLQTRITHINQTMKGHSPADLIEHGMPSTRRALTLHSDLEGSIRELRAAYTPILVFNLVERRVLSFVSASNGVEERLKNLGVGSRLLLALASSLPFIFTLPYWLRKTYIDSYQLNMDLLRRRLVESAKEHSQEVFKELEGKLLAQRRLESEIYLNTISRTFALPKGYDVSKALPLVLPAHLQAVTAAVANLVAAISALDLIGSANGQSAEVAT